VIKKLWQAKTSFMTTICKDIAHSPRKAWSQLNRYLGRKMDKSTEIIQENDQLLTSNSIIANAFSSHFSSITSVIYAIPDLETLLPSFKAPSNSLPSRKRMC
jgi:nitric oxide synthase oxygenase domain/subunit